MAYYTSVHGNITIKYLWSENIQQYNEHALPEERRVIINGNVEVRNAGRFREFISSRLPSDKINIIFTNGRTIYI